jgi:hypothetical protein
VVGAFASFLVALVSIWFVVRRVASGPIRAAIAGSSGDFSKKRSVGTAKWQTWVFVLSLAGAIASVLAGLRSGMDSAAEMFFSGGALLLIAGLLWSWRWLGSKDAQSGSDDLSLAEFSQRGVARRIGRSLAAISLLATGSFLVVALGAFKHDVTVGADKRESGTGGFALYGESAIPVFTDLNRPEGREPFGIDDAELGQVSFVQMRMKEGDDASCLNLNKAQTPRLLGVNPDKLTERKAFTFSGEMKLDGVQGGWSLLNAQLPAGEVPVIGDMNTVKWSLGKGVGQTLDYRTERGEVIKLKIVGTVASSILQGSLILSEQTFKRLFPGSSGYQAFLIDAPRRRDAVASLLGKSLENEGLDLVPAVDRLKAFAEVESTYLNIFAALGGLGLLLGSAGLGVIVLRNVMDRRSELAILRAVGFQKAGLQQLVFREHRLLLLVGMLVGVVSAVIVAVPSLIKPGSGVPVGSLTLTVIAVFVNGLFFTWMATTFALRGSLIGALRDE